MSSHHPTYTMAGLLGAGGLMGYAKRGSVPSLVAGVVLGSTFAGAGYLLQSGEMQKGHGVALAASATTAVGMGMRATSGATVPVAVTGLGLLSGVYHAKKLSDWWGQE